VGNVTKPRLLLTGASGFLGYHVYWQAKEAYQVLGISHTRTLALPGMQVLPYNLAQETGLRNLVRETRPDAIIHLAAIGDANYCQTHPAETEKINVQAAIVLAKLAAELAIPLVFTSTDNVFDGQRGQYTETDSPNPINQYGEQKALAETGIATAYPHAAICRMPLMFGPASATSKNFYQAHLDLLRKREPLKLFVDEYRTPLGGLSAAKGLVHALSAFKGIYHLGGLERLSRFELGVLMAQKAGIQQPNIIPSYQKDVQMPAPRPKDASLNSSKALSQGFQPLKVAEELGLFITQ